MTKRRRMKGRDVKGEEGRKGEADGVDALRVGALGEVSELIPATVEAETMMAADQRSGEGRRERESRADDSRRPDDRPGSRTRRAGDGVQRVGCEECDEVGEARGSGGEGGKKGSSRRSKLGRLFSPNCPSVCSGCLASPLVVQVDRRGQSLLPSTVNLPSSVTFSATHCLVACEAWVWSPAARPTHLLSDTPFNSPLSRQLLSVVHKLKLG